MKIGWIGTGMMGAPLAEHLANASYNIFAWDHDSKKMDEIKSQYRFNVVETFDEAIENAQIVMTMLGFPSDVEQMYLGENGLLNKCKPGTVLIDLTTSSPALAEKIAREGAVKGLDVFDAPVSGGVKGAQEAKLVTMLGGIESKIHVVEPLLKVFSKGVFYMGDAGKGQHTKMANQIVIAAHMAAFTEAIVYARKVGLDPSYVLDVISGGAAGSWQLSNAAPKAIAEDFVADFFVKHFVKDMRIAQHECELRELQLPVLQEVLQLYSNLEELGFANEGTQCLIRAYSS